MDLAGVTSPLEGYGSEASTLIILILLTVLSWAIKKFGPPWNWGKKIDNLEAQVRKMESFFRNPSNGIPGKSEKCQEHGIELAKLRSELEAHMAMDQQRTDAIVKEMRKSFERIHERIDRKQDKT